MSPAAALLSQHFLVHGFPSFGKQRHRDTARNHPCSGWKKRINEIPTLGRGEDNSDDKHGFLPFSFLAGKERIKRGPKGWVRGRCFSQNM